MRQPPTEPSRQEEFEHIVMKFIYDQEEKIKQLKNYMQDITDEFMEFSSEVTLRLKERVKENESKPRKIKKITKYLDTKVLENSAEHDFLKNLDRKTNGMFNIGNTKVSSIRDPRVKLAHCCIATTIAARKETTHRITEIDLYYLYSIYTPEVACNIPYWLSKYFKGMREKNLIYGGMLVTRIARSFGLLTNEWRSALSVEPQPHVFKKKLLIAMGVIMELHGGMCAWPGAMAEEEEDDEGDDEGAGGDAGQGEAEGSANLYRNMSQGDWQVHQLHWMGQQDER
ncbi:hypothetical protein Tco_0269216 [Tanacetum coccineum]